MLKIDVICDRTNQELTEVPSDVLEMTNLRMLYLEGNHLQQLPGNMFQKLPNLTWLDLRNNRLTAIPRGVAKHRYLENLLLANNEIETLPEELGSLPNLKVLLISGNPLVYPPNCIVEQGTAALCKYLKGQYDKYHPEETAPEAPPPPEEPKKKSKKVRSTMSVRELLQRSSRTAASLRTGLMPAISVRSLSNIENKAGDKNKDIDSARPKKIHKVSKCCSKISLHSYYNSNKYLQAKKVRNNEKRVEEQELKSAWMSKLKELLEDQNKILQQEKNLRALNAWRLDKKMEPPRPSNLDKILEVPYDTDPDYNTMLSREELSKQIDRMITKSKKPNSKIDIQKLIDEVVGQLRAMESSCTEVKSPRTEIENAGRQIQTILELHKKITRAKNLNNTY